MGKVDEEVVGQFEGFIFVALIKLKCAVQSSEVIIGKFKIPLLEDIKGIVEPIIEFVL
jgi:hypothetical protein